MASVALYVGIQNLSCSVTSADSRLGLDKLFDAFFFLREPHTKQEKNGSDITT